MNDSNLSLNQPALNDKNFLFESYLTKSEYTRYKNCAASFWESLRTPRQRKQDLVTEELIAESKIIHKKAYGLFTTIAEIPKSDIKTQVMLTQAFLAEGKTTLAKPTFLSAQGLLVAPDVMSYNERTKAWDIYAIRAVTGIIELHIEELAFQSYALEQAGLKLGRKYIIYLNYNYTLHERLTLANLYKKRDFTYQVRELLKTNAIPYQAAAARKAKRHALLSTEERPRVLQCTCWLKTKSDRCELFYELHPEIPAYSSFDVRLKGRNKDNFYKELFAGKFYEIASIPETLAAKAGSKKELIQLQKDQATVIDKEAIANEFSWLAYPLYFLDYETVKSGIPRWEETKPYEQVVFQYSLHVLTAPPDDPASELLHYEYLATDESDPTGIIAENLMSQIGPTGSILVWNQSFEKNRNIAIGKRYPASEEFFEDVNDRIYDLMNIFRKGFYQDWRFEGSSSIKNVLPILCPEISYKELELVSHGGEAMTLWPKAVFDPAYSKNKKEIFEALRKYCELDTYGMVKIFEYLYRQLALES